MSPEDWKSDIELEVKISAHGWKQITKSPQLIFNSESLTENLLFVLCKFNQIFKKFGFVTFLPDNINTLTPLVLHVLDFIHKRLQVVNSSLTLTLILSVKTSDPQTSSQPFLAKTWTNG